MENINFVAILVAAIASFLFGWLWYGPLFGKTWMKLEGMTPERMKSMKMKPATAMALGFISTLVMSAVLSYFVTALNLPAQNIYGAIILALLVWFGFIATTLLGGVLWENKSVKLYFFNATYQLISIFIMTKILVWIQ